LTSPSGFYQALGALDSAENQIVFDDVKEIASDITSTINFAIDNAQIFYKLGVTAVRTTDPNSRGAYIYWPPAFYSTFL